MIRKTVAIFCTVAALTAFASLSKGGEQTPAGKSVTEVSPVSGKGCGGCAKGGKKDHRCDCGCCCKCTGGADMKRTECPKDGKGAMKGGCATMSGTPATGDAPAKQ